jgi:glycosyltransferase involved in cell wall biosynthesis
METLARGFRFVKEMVRPYCRWLYLCVFPGQRASYFSASWQYPSYRLNGDSAPTVPAALPADNGQPDLLFLPMNDWHTRIQRSQQLARAFAGFGNRCFYVNPHMGCEYPLPYLADRCSRISILEPRVLEFHVHLPREHVFHGRLLTANENRRVSRALQELAGVAKIRRAIQIVSFPIWLETAKALRARFGFPIVYDCHDLLRGFRNVAPDIIAAEAGLFNEADLVVFCSAWLMKDTIASFPGVAEKSILVRNGVDIAHFSGALRDREPGRQQAGKVVGYVGALDHWFDVETVSRAARAYPDWSFQLIGRVEDRRVEALREFPNVEFTGEVAYANLPAYMAHFDIAMIPFIRNNLTLATNPIKLYEYFSLGLPVVSTRFPEVELYGVAAYLADDPGQFVSQLAAAAAETDTSLRLRRMAIAQVESWQTRAAQLLEALRPTVTSGHAQTPACDAGVAGDRTSEPAFPSRATARQELSDRGAAR